MQEAKKIIITCLFFLFCQSSFAIDDKPYFDLFSVADNIVNLNSIQDVNEQDTLIDKFQQVINKTKQGNPHSAREDLKRISQSIKNDYQRLNFAKFLYSNGYFLLADEVLNSVHSKEELSKTVALLRNVYAIKYPLTEEQENILHKTLSLIYQDNLPHEASFDLKKQEELINNSDYANYVMSCAFFALGQYDKSLQYIDQAISINDINLSYKLYKTKIYVVSGEAKKAIDYISDNGFGNEILRNEFLKLYYKAAASLAKKIGDKKYYEALVCYLDCNFYGAIEALRAGLLLDDKNLKLNYLLFKSLVNIKDVSAAQKIADKMHSYNPKSPYVQEVFGDLNFIDANYVAANGFYSKAVKLKTGEVYSKLILVNTILGNNDKVEKYTKKALGVQSYMLDDNYQIAIGILSNANFKNLNSNDEANYKNAKNSLRLHYLRKALQVNPFDSYYLLEMVDSVRGSVVHNFNLLELITMLGDFNFYYCWKFGEFEDFIGNKEKAVEYYKKSAALNPSFEPAIRAISGFNL